MSWGVICNFKGSSWAGVMMATSLVEAHRANWQARPLGPSTPASLPQPAADRHRAPTARGPANRPSRRAQAYGYGIDAERSVTLFLVSGGYTILGRRVRLRAGEVDIIAHRGDTVSFVEVKARKRGWDGLLAVDRRKQRRLSRAADEWLSQHDEWAHCSICFDIALVWRTCEIEYLENAFDTIEADDFVW